MNAEKQKVAIAEFCGFEKLEHYETGLYGWIKRTINKLRVIYAPANSQSVLVKVPDYPNDLNAMHEAWKCLPKELRLRFSEALFAIVVRDEQQRNGKPTTILDLPTQIDGLIENASAAQRCEAMVRTIGKWEGGQ